MRRALLVLFLATLPGCPARKADPAPAPSASAALASASVASSPSAAPSASATASAGADPRAEPPPPPSVIEVTGKAACIPPKLVAEGNVTVVAGGKGGVAFCFVAENARPKACYGLDFETGEYTDLPTFPAPPATKRSSGGTHLLERATDGVSVCDVTGKACKTFPAKGIGGKRDPAKLLADVSPDGKRVVTVTQAGGTETFDLAGGKSEKKSSIHVDGFVDGVAWLGKRVMVIGCVDAGPGCTPQLWEPESSKATRVAANVYASKNPAHPVSGSLWAFVDSTGDAIAFHDVDTGLARGTMAVGLGGDVERGVATDRKKPGEIAIVSSGPHGGSIVHVDLVAKKVLKRYTPGPCKK